MSDFMLRRPAIGMAQIAFLYSASMAAGIVDAAGLSPAAAPQHIALHTPVAASSNPAVARDVLILSAPPRDSETEGHRIFDPLAAYLSQVLGRPVIYKNPATWGGYQADMQANAYDIVFDGPHFNSWRVRHRDHNVLARLPGNFVYTAVVRQDNIRVAGLRQLAGHRICAHAPPNLGTLIMFREFDNPSRQPVVVVKDGYRAIYEALLHGECEAAMLPLAYLATFDHDQTRARVIFQTTSMPQQAFSAGPRVTASEQTRIASALLSPAALAPLANFHAVYGGGRELVAAHNTEYANLDVYLRDEWGFN